MMLIGFRKVKCGANLGIQDALLMGESYDCVGKYMCIYMCICTLVYLHVSAGTCTHTYVCIEKLLI